MTDRRTLIIYFTRTGRTKRLAEHLARELNADIEKIRCPRYRLGLFGWWRYLMAGYNSVRGRLPRIRKLKADPMAYDLVLLGTPIWTSYPSLPMRSLLRKRPDLPARIAAFVTYGGQSEPDKAFDMMADLLGRPIDTRLAIQQHEGDLPDMEAKAQTFIERLG